MKRVLERSLRRIERQFDELAAWAPRGDVRADRVSGWSIGQHLDHLCKADRSIVARFAEPATEPLPPLTLAGRLVLATGWIPRGRGKAPAAVAPELASPAELAAQVLAVRALVTAALGSPERLADPRPVSRHHIFGGLSAARWVRFLAVHHHHHLKIIRDIERAASA
ncbi:MAG: DinB family protein [Acidobacteriota bacterium]|nr:DinB family protein [Acidobacteriota bacterium]MDH3525725.1 DinB family protein [Acidobacteriota bacterium]